MGFGVWGGLSKRCSLVRGVIHYDVSWRSVSSVKPLRVWGSKLFGSGFRVSSLGFKA